MLAVGIIVLAEVFVRSSHIWRCDVGDHLSAAVFPMQLFILVAFAVPFVTMTILLMKCKPSWVAWWRRLFPSPLQDFGLFERWEEEKTPLQVRQALANAIFIALMFAAGSVYLLLRGGFSKWAVPVILGLFFLYFAGIAARIALTRKHFDLSG